MKKKQLLVVSFGATVLIMVFLSVPSFTLAQQAGFSIDTPASMNLPNASWSLTDLQTTVDFTSPVVVSSVGPTTTGFTAQVTSTDLQMDGGPPPPPPFIGYTNLEIKTGVVTTELPDGITAPIDGLYTSFPGGIASTSDPINFMLANSTNRNAGSWSITPSLRLTIPARQSLGTYHATLTFSLS